MRRYLLDFVRRGLPASVLGPIVLGVIYLVINRQTGIEFVTIKQVCMGIFSLTALAFIAGGMNFIYQVEKLPLLFAILIHGGVLYISYLIVYLLNGWLEAGVLPLLVFTLIFIFGFFVIWLVISFVMKKKSARLNVMLKRRQNR